jgi:hypothetical protein
MELIETKVGNQGEIYSRTERLRTSRVYYLKKITILHLKMFAQLENHKQLVNIHHGNFAQQALHRIR